MLFNSSFNGLNKLTRKVHIIKQLRNKVIGSYKGWSQLNNAVSVAPLSIRVLIRFLDENIVLHVQRVAGKFNRISRAIKLTTNTYNATIRDIFKKVKYREGLITSV